jgi:predicted phage terminase large subunit-like protein
MNPENDTEIFEVIAKDRLVRQAVTRKSHLLFFHVYLAHYVTYEIAEFQKDIFRITEDQANKLAIIVAFRGSGKSTLVTLSYSLWAMLGIQQKKFVLVICQTQSQAKQHMMNLKRELESNHLLQSDLGPFQEEGGEWGSSSLVFPQRNARITAVSTEQSIRGLRHNQFRPDLIICDDVEDLASVKTRESRQKTYNWFTGEVVPTGDRATRTIVVGNLLHDDSLVMHLKRDIDEGQRDGIYKAYPLIDEHEDILWPGKYPTQEAIAEEKRKSGNEFAWQREYLLRIIPDEDQVIDREWIQYYDDIPARKSCYSGIFTGVDLAISERDTADYTAIVSALFYKDAAVPSIYILPNIINKRMNFPDTITQIKEISDANKRMHSSYLLVEEVGYQKAVIDQLLHDSFNVTGVKVVGDKRSRLTSIATMIQTGRIKFPRHGAEELVRQIVGFGAERHDDLVDAFTIVAHHAIQFDEQPPSTIVFVPRTSDRWEEGERNWSPAGYEQFERSESWY